MNKFKFIIFILSFYLLSFAAFPQTYYWKSYSPIKKIKVLMIDGQYLWAAYSFGIARINLQDNSVNIFDCLNSSVDSEEFYSGYKMSNGEIWFSGDNGFYKVKNNNTIEKEHIYGRILRIFESSDGAIWYSKYDELGVYQRKNGIEKKLEFGNSFTDTLLFNVCSIAEDKNGAMWFGTYEYGLFKYYNNNWQVFLNKNSSLPSNYVFDIKVDKNNNLILGTARGIAFYNQVNNTWQIYNSNNGLISNRVTNLLLSNDTLYIGIEKAWYDNNSVGGIQMYYNGQFKEIYSLWSVSVYSIAKTNNGSIFFSMFSEYENSLNGLFEYKGDYSRKIYLRGSFDFYDNSIFSIASNQKGDVFFANYKYVYKLNSYNNFDEFYSNLYGWSDNIVHYVYVDPLDRLWIAETKNEQLFLNTEMYPNKVFTGVSNHSYPYQNVNRIFVRDNNNIFISSEKGLYKNKYNGQSVSTITVYTTSNSALPTNSVKAAVLTSDNILWIATSQGLVKVSGSNWQIFNTSNSPLIDNYVRDLKIDKYGNIWVANGYSEYDKIALLKISPSGNITLIDSSYVWKKISIAKDNTIWGIGLNSLQAWSNGIKYSFTSQNGTLPFAYNYYSNLMAIEVDKYDRIWIGTYDRGVFSLTIDKEMEFPFERLWIDKNPYTFINNTIRGIAYSKGKIFVAHYSSSSYYHIYVYEAYSGYTIKTLDTLNLSGGDRYINDIEASEDGKIFICNLTTNSGTTAFKIYKMDNIETKPMTFISYKSGNYRLGDNFRVVGNYNTTAVIYAPAANSNKVLKWVIKNGSLQSQTPQIISLQNYTFKTVPSVYPISTSENSDFFANSHSTKVAYFNADGTKIDSISSNVIPTNSSALSFFNYKNKNYLATFQYVSNLYDTNRQNIRLVELSAPYYQMSQNSIYGITERIGQDNNPNATGDVAHWIDGTNVYIAVLATNGGLAVYRCSKPPFNQPSTNVEEQQLEDNRYHKDFHISQNYPNPFNGATNIKYILPKSSSIEISVYDILGRKVFEEKINNLNPGEYFYRFDAESLNFSSGIYIFAFKACEGKSILFTKAIKMTYLK